MKILLLTKSTPWCHLVQEVLRKSEHDVTVVEGVNYQGQPYTAAQGPQAQNWRVDWHGDLIISYLFPHVLSASDLALAPRAINFHPAPPWHPGFAPYSWAIYHSEFSDYGDLNDYGVTVHVMKSKVDTGYIIRSKQFEIRRDDSVVRLQHRTMRHLFALFQQMLSEGFPWTTSANDLWLKEPATKAQFEDLRRLSIDMDAEDIEARIRACRYPGQPGAYFPGEPA